MAYEIGSRIRKYRKAKNLSQKDFAALLGVSASRANNWENGVNRPDIELLADICRILQVSPSELLDVRIDPEELSPQERRVIMAYRTKTHLQQAVDILLGVDDTDKQKSESE